MTLHPDPECRSIPVKAVIRRPLGARSQRINSWIPAEQPAATICRTEAGYELKEGEIRPTWQMYRVLTGQEKKRHFGLIRLDPEKPSPTILGDTGCTTAGLVQPYEVGKLSIAEIKALASYPEEFQLMGSYRARWARIGNSVPPLLMKAIAEHILQHLFMNESSTP